MADYRDDQIPDPTPAEPPLPGTVVSLRLPGDFAAALRHIAGRRGISLSDLMRTAAGGILCDEGLCTCPNCPQRPSG